MTETLTKWLDYHKPHLSFDEPLDSEHLNENSVRTWSELKLTLISEVFWEMMEATSKWEILQLNPLPEG